MSTMFSDKTVLDLTLELSAGKQSWNLHPPLTMVPYHQPELDQWRNGQLSPGFASRLLMFTDHIGTHMDAQLHFHPQGKSIAEMPLSSLMGEALLLDVSRPEQGRPITVADLEKALADAGESLRPGDMLLLKCWPLPWGEGENFDNADALDGPVADWLLDHQVKLLGTDVPTVDYLGNAAKDIHYKLLEKNVPIIENLINLEKITQARFPFMALPLRIQGATGSPVRALAFLERERA